jgi:hypothetical protein
MSSLDDMVIGLFRSLIVHWNSPYRYVILLFIVGMVCLFFWDESRRKRKFAAASYQSVTLHDDEKGTLHLLERGVPKLPRVLMDLRTFETADQVYHYVYKEFGEAAFARLVIHRASGEDTVTFVHDAQQSDEENVARLQAMMFG